MLVVKRAEEPGARGCVQSQLIGTEGTRGLPASLHPPQTFPLAWGAPGKGSTFTQPRRKLGAERRASGQPQMHQGLVGEVRESPQTRGSELSWHLHSPWDEQRRVSNSGKTLFLYWMHPPAIQMPSSQKAASVVLVM